MDRIAKTLGVTTVGLSVLARAVADPEGKARGSAKGNPGSAKVRLERDGYLTANSYGGLYESTITDAGREIVRRARAMGW
jgi:hypothetical protein